MLREDEEFRYAVMGLLGITDIQSSIRQLINALNRVLEVVRTWRMRNYVVTHYRCGLCGGSFNHYRDPSTGREFILRSGKRRAK